jgi:hypothetical protein
MMVASSSDEKSLTVLRFGFFQGYFLFNFARNPTRNCWICRFEWLILYNLSAPGFFSMLNPFLHS